MLDLNTIQQQIQDNGAFCLLQWLLERGILPYQTYELWRYGELAELEPEILLSSEQVSQLLEQTDKLAKSLKLSAEKLCYYNWNPEQAETPLSLCVQSVRSERLGQRWVRPQDMPQLDLFMDCGAITVEHDLLAALASRDWTGAARAYAKLLEAVPNNTALASYDSLILYGQHLANQPDIPAVDLDEELTALAQEIAPLAHTILRAQARDYLAPAWQRLARSLRGRAFDPQQPFYHASYALARIPDWPGVIDCLLGDSRLIEHSELLRRLADAMYHHQLPEKSLLIWCVLFEQYPAEAERLVNIATSAIVRELWQQFLSLDEEPGSEHFSGWILLKQPGLLHHLTSNSSSLMPQSLSFTTMRNLLQVRRQQGDEIEARKALQQQCPALLRCYLKK